LSITIDAVAIALYRKVCDHLNVVEDDIIKFCQRWKIVEFGVFGSILRDDFWSLLMQRFSLGWLIDWICKKSLRLCFIALLILCKDVCSKILICVPRFYVLV
jgi:hypothetical protein